MLGNIDKNPGFQPLQVDKAFEQAADPLRPSEYTASLMHALRIEPQSIEGASVLEIGSGSGVVLGMLGQMGAASLCGVDIEQVAIDSGTELLDKMGFASKTELHRGHIWQPVAGRRFDLIVANLPHFPMPHKKVPGRLSSWSVGGSDGRLLLDPFLTGLSDHMTPGGRAVLTHNAFVGLERSRKMMARRGMSLRPVTNNLVCIPPEKMQCMTSKVFKAQSGRTIHTYGKYSFGEMQVVEIRKMTP